MSIRELLRVPDPLNTLEDWERHTGRDLAFYDRPDLNLERGRLRLALLILDDRPRSWRDRQRVEWVRDRLIRVEHRLREGPGR